MTSRAHGIITPDASTGAPERARWERETLAPALARRPSGTCPSPRSRGGPSSGSTRADDLAAFDYARDAGDPGRVPIHARHPPHGLPRQALDDAPVRGVWDAGGDQRPLQAAARRRRHGAERRVRPADAHGPRPRPRAVARRGWEVRGQHRVARRHGDALRRHPARRHHDVDDDQLAGVDAVRDVSRRRRAAGGELADRCRERFRTTS